MDSRVRILGSKLISPLAILLAAALRSKEEAQPQEKIDPKTAIPDQTTVLQLPPLVPQEKKWIVIYEGNIRKKVYLPKEEEPLPALEKVIMDEEGRWIQIGNFRLGKDYFEATGKPDYGGMNFYNPPKLGFRHARTVERIVDDEFEKWASVFERQTKAPKTKFDPNFFNTTESYHHFLNKVLRLYLYTDIDAKGIAEVLMKHYISPTLGLTSKDIYRLINQELNPYMKSIKFSRFKDRKNLREAYFSWAEAKNLTRNEYETKDFESNSDPEIQAGGWKTIRRARDSNNGTLGFTDDEGRLYCAHNDRVQGIMDSLNMWYDYKDYLTSAGRYRRVPDWKNVTRHISEVVSSIQDKQKKDSAYLMLTNELEIIKERVCIFQESYHKFFINVIKELHSNYENLLKEKNISRDTIVFVYDELNSGYAKRSVSKKEIKYSAIESILFSLDAKYTSFALTGDSNELLDDLRLLSGIYDRLMETSVVEAIGAMIKEVHRLEKIYSSNIDKGFSNELDSLIREGLITIEDTFGLSKVFEKSENLFSGGLWVPNSNDGGYHIRMMENIADAVEKPFPLASLDEFLEYVDKFDPIILNTVKNSIGKQIRIRDAKGAGKDYQSSLLVAYAVLDEVDTAILKLTNNPTMILEHFWLQAAAKHNELSCVVAGPIGPLMNENGLYADLRANAEMMVPGSVFTSLSRDPFLHMIAIAAKIDAWGDYILDDNSIIPEYHYRSGEEHVRNILTTKDRARNFSETSIYNDRIYVEKLFEIYNMALENLGKRRERPTIVSVRDLTGRNTPNGRLVDADSLCKTKFPEVGVARALMDAEAYGFVDLDRDTINFYRQFYNFFRTAETNKRYESSLISPQIIEYITREELDDAMIVDGFQYGANFGLHRPQEAQNGEKILARVAQIAETYDERITDSSHDVRFERASQSFLRNHPPGMVAPLINSQGHLYDTVRQ
ncbi:MAG: hypothetical protein ABIJ34_03250 [archaeon]